MISGSTELPPEFKRDEKGYLTFRQAKEVGRKQLDRLPFEYAVDIEVAHKEWGIKPEIFDIPSEWEKIPIINSGDNIQMSGKSYDQSSFKQVGKIQGHNVSF